MAKESGDNMKAQIAYYTQQLEKVIGAYGLCSEATDSAMFKLQAIKSGMPEKEIFAYAEQKMKELHDLALQSPYLN